MDGVVEIGGGFLGLVGGEVAQRAGQQRFGQLRRKTVRRGEIGDREFVLFFALIEQAAIVIGLGFVGTKRNGLVEIFQRLRGLDRKSVV